MFRVIVNPVSYCTQTHCSVIVAHILLFCFFKSEQKKKKKKANEGNEKVTPPRRAVDSTGVMDFIRV